MKSLAKYVLLGLVFVLVSAHLEHKAALEGYVQGCKDNMNQIYRGLGFNNEDQSLLDNYCRGLMDKYGKKQ